jgi:hypothetical protein
MYLDKIIKLDLNRKVSIRSYAGVRRAFIQITFKEMEKNLSYSLANLKRMIPALTKSGILIVTKADYLYNINTNCYAINYEKLLAYVEHQVLDHHYSPRFIALIEEMRQENPFNVINKKIPAFRRRIGKYFGRKCIVNPRGNSKISASLEWADNGSTHSLPEKSATQKTPLQGYINQRSASVNPVDKYALPSGLSYESSRYGTLSNQAWLNPMYGLVYNVGVLVESLVKGIPNPLERRDNKRRKWVDLKRTKDYFSFIGAMLKREIFYPSKEALKKWVAWIKAELGGDLTAALEFNNLYKYKKILRNRYKRATMQQQSLENISHSAKIPNFLKNNGAATVKPSLTREEKLEEIQYFIASNEHESRAQKEARLMILNKIGPDNYNAWFKNLSFEGESDYQFVVPSQFVRDYMTNKYDLNTYKYNLFKHITKTYG